jgi:hypothetical protein
MKPNDLQVILRKSKPSESYFGFNMQEEGIVTEVDMNKVNLQTDFYDKEN